MDTHATFCPSCRRHFEADRHLCPRCGLDTIRPSGGLPEYGELVDERFVRLEELGVGGMSVVYRSFDTERRREVALKVVRPRLALRSDGVDRFFREARMLRGLRHPNIVAPSDFGCTQTGLLYLTMELLVGEPLSDVLRERGRMATDRALALAQQAAEALSTVHRAGVLHRDLKPDNFRLLPGDLLKMLDFGIATHLGESPAEEGAGRQRQICGTPQYMSPERALGEREDERSDLYGLGVLLYELLAGRTPFVGDSPVDVVRQHLCEPPPPFSELGVTVPAPVDAIVMELLRKEPSQRPATAAATVQLLRAARTQLLPQMPTYPPHSSSTPGGAEPFHERCTLLIGEPAEPSRPSLQFTFPELYDGDSPTLRSAVLLCRDCRGIFEASHSVCPHCGARPNQPAAEGGAATPIAALECATRSLSEGTESSAVPRVPPRILSTLDVRFPTNLYGLRTASDEVLTRWLDRTQRLGGTTVLDDGGRLRVAFGLTPSAHEAPALALAALAAAYGLFEALGATDAQDVRAAVATGPVYLETDGLSAPAWALRGSAVDFASRLAETANLGEIRLDEATAQAVGGEVTLRVGPLLAARGHRQGAKVRVLPRDEPQAALASRWKQVSAPPLAVVRDNGELSAPLHQPASLPASSLGPPPIPRSALGVS